MSGRISLVIEDPRWEKTRGLAARVKRAAALAAERGGQKHAALTILLASDARLRELNLRFRGRAAPTNVLSFPALGKADDYLGDIAVAHGIATHEARASGKTLTAHTAHLAVHGVLHLLGYDHKSKSGAHVMEPLETAILSELGIANPYATAVA